LLFANGRRRTIHQGFGTVHQVFQTPSVALVGITVGTLAGLFLGDALLVPVTEVGSMASALGWFAACLSFWIVEKRTSMRIVTGMGIAVSLMLFLMKVLPVFPGHFSLAEWISLGIWVTLGIILRVWGESANWLQSFVKRKKEFNFQPRERSSGESDLSCILLKARRSAINDSFSPSW